MSRLTLGGRKRAGGKVHKHWRQSEEEHENVVTQREDLLRTVDESHDRSAPKYTYYLKYLTVSRIFLESEHSLLLAVASVERNLAGKSYSTNIWKWTRGACLRWEEVLRKRRDMFVI